MTILFDGVCNLCNAAVNFIIDHDKNNVFTFASLQSEFGQKFSEKHNKNQTDFDSIVLLDGENYYTKSEAIYKIFKYVAFPYSMVDLGRFLPKFLSNIGYDFIARNRYSFFGKRESCRMPTKELKEKFLD